MLNINLPIGASIGSSKIDEAFQRLVHQRLCSTNWRVCGAHCPNRKIATRMSESSKFQIYKCNFGKPRFTDFVTFQHPNFGFKLLQYEILLRLLPYSANQFVVLRWKIC